MPIKRLLRALQRLAEPAKAAAGDPLNHLVLQAEVALDAQGIRLLRRNGDNGKIDWKDVDFITLDRYEDSMPVSLHWVNFRSFRVGAVCVPSTAKGFDTVTRYLETLENVDLTRLRQVQTSTDPVNNDVIWQRASEADFTLAGSSTSPSANLDQGIYLENFDTLLPWGTYEALACLPFVITQQETYPNPDFSGLRYIIRQPVIANGVKLKQLYTLTDAARGAPALHLPVLSYTADVTLGRNPAKAFSKLQQHLDQYFGNAAAGQPDSTNGQQGLEAQWKQSRVTVTLRCHYREELRQLDTIAWLQIHHEPDLTPFFTSAYGSALKLSDKLKWKLFPVTIDIAADYRRMDNAMYTPACFHEAFEDNHYLLIWMDPDSNIIGFANRQMALTFSHRDCASLTLITHRFRGEESSNMLELRVKDATVVVGGLADRASFEQYQENIAQWTGLNTGQCFHDEYY